MTLTRARLIEVLGDLVAHTSNETYRELLKLALGTLPDDYVFERVKEKAPEVLAHG